MWPHFFGSVNVSVSSGFAEKPPSQLTSSAKQQGARTMDYFRWFAVTQIMFKVYLLSLWTSKMGLRPPIVSSIMSSTLALCCAVGQQASVRTNICIGILSVRKMLQNENRTIYHKP